MGAFAKLIYHVVFSKKYRRKTIDDGRCEPLYEYIGGIIRGQKGHLIEIGGVEDHIHILANLSPVTALSNAIRDIKANSSKWVNDLKKTRDRFEWQKGYGAFTVSYSQIDSVRHYIQNQREHHRRQTFEEEYIEFLNRHDIPFERKWLFEDEHHG